MIRRNKRDGGRQTNHEQEGEEENKPISKTDPVHSIVSSKPTISSLLFNTFSPPTNHTDNSTAHKKKSFITSGKFGGLGCAASSQVSVPTVIRTSANWEIKKVKKKKQKGKKNKRATISSDVDAGNVSGINSIYNNSNGSSLCALSFTSSCVAAPDVWCGPGTGLTTDAASVDYVVSRRPIGRGKVDGGERISHRERPSCSVRRMVDSEDNPFHDYDAAVGVQHIGVEAFGHHRNSQNQNSFPEEFAEIMMLQSRLLLGGRLDGLDRHRDLRLDVDSMSYEELLELGDKIGHVSTGLREDEINCCLRNVKPSVPETFSLLLPETERKCSICQEEYEADDEIGKLNCRHCYHIKCIKLWLQHKNICPVCKIEAKSRS